MDPETPQTPDKEAIRQVMSAMGRKGGLKGGKARLLLPKKERRRLARNAVKVRWAKYKKNHASVQPK